MMADETLIYPILDLLKEEMRDRGWDGSVGEVALIREHPLDEYTLTGVTVYYKDGTHAEIGLSRGSDKVSTYPKAVQKKPYHPDYKYCRDFRLERVLMTHFRDLDTPMYSMEVTLHYNTNGLLSHTTLDIV